MAISQKKTLDQYKPAELLKLPPLELFELVYEEDNIEAVYRAKPGLEQRMQKLSHYYDKFCESINLGELDVLITQDDEDVEEIRPEHRFFLVAIFASLLSFIANLFKSEKEEEKKTVTSKANVFSTVDTSVVSSLYDVSKPSIEHQGLRKESKTEGPVIISRHMFKM